MDKKHTLDQPLFWWQTCLNTAEQSISWCLLSEHGERQTWTFRVI